MNFGPDSWSYGLIKAIEDKSKIIFRSEELVCIRDLYPKSRNHFLIIPECGNFDNIYDLRKEDIQLVEEMELLGINSIELNGNKVENFRMGFHIKPSMKRLKLKFVHESILIASSYNSRLHLHVVSKDFDSPSLKHKKHWNSFNTDFLVHPQTVIKDLEEYGEVQRPADDVIKNFIEQKLKCNSCNYVPKHMPDLKKHLLTHVDLYKGKLD